MIFFPLSAAELEARPRQRLQHLRRQRQESEKLGTAAEPKQRRGVYPCALHDIFFILRLLSCSAVNMMDNVLGLGLMGVICCLHHQLWRAETGRKEKAPMRGADRGQQTEGAEPVLITAKSCWGWTKLGRFEVESLKNFPVSF